MSDATWPELSKCRLEGWERGGSCTEHPSKHDGDWLAVITLYLTRNRHAYLRVNSYADNAQEAIDRCAALYETHFGTREEDSLYQVFRQVLEIHSPEEVLAWGEKNWPGLVEAFDAMGGQEARDAPEADLAGQCFDEEVHMTPAIWAKLHEMNECKANEYLAGFLRWLADDKMMMLGTPAGWSVVDIDIHEEAEHLAAEYRAHLQKGAEHE